MADVEKLTQDLITQLSGRLNSLNQILSEMIHAYYATDKSAQIFHQYQEASISKLRSLGHVNTLMDPNTPDDLRSLHDDLARDEEVLQSMSMPKDKEAIKTQALQETRELIQIIERIQTPEASPVAETVETEPAAHKPTR